MTEQRKSVSPLVAIWFVGVILLNICTMVSVHPDQIQDQSDYFFMVVGWPISAALALSSWIVEFSNADSAPQKLEQPA